MWVMSPTHASAMEASEDKAAAQEQTQLQGLPHGQPVVYGPVQPDRTVAVNPFWSEKVKDEVVLRSLRPQVLPGLESSTAGASTSSEDTSRGMPDMRQLLAIVLQQSSLLKQELDELKDQGKTQKEPRVVEYVVKGPTEPQTMARAEISNTPQDQAPLPLEYGKVEEAEQAQGHE